MLLLPLSKQRNHLLSPLSALQKLSTPTPTSLSKERLPRRLIPPRFALPLLLHSIILWSVLLPGRSQSNLFPPPPLFFPQLLFQPLPQILSRQDPSLPLSLLRLSPSIPFLSLKLHLLVPPLPPVRSGAQLELARRRSATGILPSRRSSTVILRYPRPGDSCSNRQTSRNGSRLPTRSSPP